LLLVKFTTLSIGRWRTQRKNRLVTSPRGNKLCRKVSCAAVVTEAFEVLRADRLAKIDLAILESRESSMCKAMWHGRKELRAW